MLFGHHKNCDTVHTPWLLNIWKYPNIFCLLYIFVLSAYFSCMFAYCRYKHMCICALIEPAKKKRRKTKLNACTAKITHKHILCIWNDLCRAALWRHIFFIIIIIESSARVRKLSKHQKKKTLFTIKAWITVSRVLNGVIVVFLPDWCIYEEEYLLFMLTILEYIDGCETCASWRYIIL